MRRLGRYTLKPGDPVRIIRDNGVPSRSIYTFVRHVSSSDELVWWKPTYLRHQRWCLVQPPDGSGGVAHPKPQLIRLRQLRRP